MILLSEELFKIERAPLRHVLKLTGLALLFAITVSLTLYVFGLPAYESADQEISWQLVFFALIASPILENGVVIVVFEIARKLRAPGWSPVIIPSVAMAALHSFISLYWGVVVMALFLVIALTYHFNRDAGSGRAYLFGVAIHTLNNLAAISVLALPEL
jgi:hypothetical protein